MIILTLLATVFSMAWYKIVVQPFLVVYSGLYPSKENCMIFRKVTGFGPWFHAVGTGSFWLRGIHGSVTKELIWLPRGCCPVALSVIVARWIAADSSVLFTIKRWCYGFDYRIFGCWLILCATHRHCIKMALYTYSRPCQKTEFFFFNFICRMYRLHFRRHQLKMYFFGVLSWRTRDVRLSGIEKSSTSIMRF